jgi:hypothetical protein
MTIRKRLTGAFWWRVHNVAAHLWIGCRNSLTAWRFHDWTADRMTVPARPAAQPAPQGVE